MSEAPSNTKLAKQPFFHYTDVMVESRDVAAQAAFREAQELWRAALESHRSAPPDAGFSGRLAALAQAARAEAAACLLADGAGFEWPPHRASSSKPPWELQPGSGRRGPDAGWRRFDAAVSELSRAATGTDLVEVVRAYEELADVRGCRCAAGRSGRARGSRRRAARRRPALCLTENGRSSQVQEPLGGSLTSRSGSGPAGSRDPHRAPGRPIGAPR